MRVVPSNVVQKQDQETTPQEDILEESRKWLEIIKTPLDELSRYQRQRVVKETIQNFNTYLNPGYFEIRKSSVEAGDETACEWQGRGTRFIDMSGREYLDFLGGYGIYSAGIGHPRVIEAVQAQLHKMPLSSQELFDPLRGALASLLGELLPGDLRYSFFISNGTDAVEGALKLACLYTGRSGFISAIRGFHGKSLGSLSLMGKAQFRAPFQSMLGDVRFTPFGDADAVEAELEKARLVGQGIAAVVVEPVQGEAGVIVPPDEYWPRLREICDAYDVLLIADEVQTGMGRTGQLWGVDHWDVVPDIMCLGKALGGGVMPLSAFCASPRVWKVMEQDPLVHTSTFGGNPLACAAGIAAINVTLEEKLPEKARASGKYMLQKLQAMQRRYPHLIQEVRGLGLLIGVEFHNIDIGYKVAAGLFRRGVLVAGTMINCKTIRLEPALNIEREDLDECLEKLDDTLSAMKKTRPKSF